jgi:hypothetical protein
MEIMTDLTKEKKEFNKWIKKLAKKNGTTKY